jgi:hypothetical protein
VRQSTTAIVDVPVPKFMSVAHFCSTYGASPSEVEIIGIDGVQFVDLEATKTKMLILRAKFK